jgi:phosphohistidine phosphatase SixA
LNGGYILHFRHAERDKWIDVQMYDVLESDLHTNGIDESRYAENDYFSQAVCLNERGKIQAKAMGEHIQHIGLPISTVVSTVSCRGRQTADLAFGGYDSLHRLLVHKGPYNETDADRIRILKEFYGSLPVTSDSNVIVSAHNGVVKMEMFENLDSSDPILNLEEGGFYIISQRNGKLYLEHEFHYFRQWTSIFYDR